MCGVTGFWQPTGCSEEQARQTIRRMADALIHRGPDDAGEWLVSRWGIGGWPSSTCRLRAVSPWSLRRGGM